MIERDYSYKVSVCIITYNQAEYIEKTVDGALAQEVDFPYEIIIGDDCSTDGTREILLDYKQKHPDLIKLNLQEDHDEEGIAGRRNNITNIRSAQGQYIAFCDGDDYWISKDKLQKQADFMDAHPEYSFCIHDALYKWEQTNREFWASNRHFHLRRNRSITAKELAFRTFSIPSCTMFFRTKYIKDLPDWFWDVHGADHALQYMAIEHGNAFYLKDVKSVHLTNKKSVTMNYYQQKGRLNIYENDLQIYLEHLNIEPSFFMMVDAKRFYTKFSQRLKKGRLFSAGYYFFESYRIDKKILKKVFHTLRSHIYYLFNN